MGIIESVQQYDLNIPAGGAQAIDVAGDRVQFLSAVDPFAQIEIRPNFAQGNIVLRPGQGFRFSEQVQRWVVFNKGSVALSGLLVIGTGDFFDQRIAGTVDVIDGGKARTMANVAFCGGAQCLNSVGNMSHVQLWNPAGNTKRLVLENVLLTSSQSIGPHIRTANTALSVLGGNGNATGKAPSKLVGGAVCSAELRTQNAASEQGPDMYIGLILQANTPYVWRVTEQIVINPGYGVNVTGGVNVDIGASFEFFEEAF